MNPIITEQIEKFKTGDFRGYESFYNETVNTVYTMLQTIVNDQNVATSLVPQVYDQIYKNTETLEQTEGFYQWAAEFANAEALGFLQENHLTGTISSAPAAEITEQFYDYAAEDAALTITETEVADASFVTKLQEIVQTLSPIERVVFQEYYYFGVGVPEIAVKTGCKDADIRYTLSRTRTSILHAITEAATATGNMQNPGVQNADERRYHLSEAPWLWIAYQNYLGYTLGIDTASIAGWSVSVLGQVAGMVGAEGVVATGTGATGISGAGGVGGMAGAAGASGAAVGTAGAAGAGGIAAGVLGTIGGKIALGVIGAALATGIGFGVHHAVTKNQATTEITTTTEATSETTENVTEASSETTEATTEAATEATTEAVNEAIVHAARQSYKEFLTDILNKNEIDWIDDEYPAYSFDFWSGQYTLSDINGDDIPELIIDLDNGAEGDFPELVYRYNQETQMVEPYINTPINSTYYLGNDGSVYIKTLGEDIPSSEAGRVGTPGTYQCSWDIKKVSDDGRLIMVEHIRDWSRDILPTDFPAEYDLDGDGIVYCFTEYIGGNTTTKYGDESDYDSFFLGLGKEIFYSSYAEYSQYGYDDAKEKTTFQVLTPDNVAAIE